MSSSSRASYLPQSYLAALPAESEISISTLVAEQDRLAEEAREAMPYAFDECTYEKGYLRQSVWSCIDCGEKGVCYGCSISCHSEHKLVELWTRRHFRCDCPTTSMQPGPSSSSSGAKRRKCTLNPPQIQPAEENTGNRYTKNLSGRFCRCGREYDAEKEEEGMICCIACEDWFHESCLNLRPRAPITPEESSLADIKPYPQPDTTIKREVSIPETAADPAQAIEEEEEEEEDGSLIPSESYDGLICGQCVQGHKVLRERAGNEGWMMIVPNGKGEFEVIGRLKDADRASSQSATKMNQQEIEDRQGHDQESGNFSKKRSPDTSLQEGDTKRRKLKGEQPASESERGAGDVFLANGEREKLKHELDADTIASLPFPLDDEEIYEPPKEEELEETLDEVTARVVDHLPRAQAIEAVHGYQRMKDRLQSMLAAHATEGRVVSKSDIEEMFLGLRGKPLA